MPEASPIELELRKLGLTEKEVRVYLAGLGLGPSSVQKIAKSANLTRPTTYEIIKKLEEKRLFVEAGKKGKRVFVAQSPESILGILKTRKREIEEKEKKLKEKYTPEEIKEMEEHAQDFVKALNEGMK